MTIKRARVLAQPKPWGVGDLRPWFGEHRDADLIGELHYHRADDTAPPTALLLKLLFTNTPLSIQVHPGDAYAKAMGLPNGKTEAWYILSAAPGARIALGLKRSATPQQLRRAIDDGSISELVAWRSVKAHDVIFVPAGTIHAIGAGIVIAEIQQRSDATFRLYDHGRGRALDVQHGTAVAKFSLTEATPPPKRLTQERLLLVANSHFVFERLTLAPGSAWRLDAERETWLLALGGNTNVGPINLVRGEAVLAQSEPITIRAGRLGAECLVAYTGIGGPVPNLLQPIIPLATNRPRYARASNEPPAPIGPTQ